MHMIVDVVVNYHWVLMLIVIGIVISNYDLWLYDLWHRMLPE
jgi:hypothetical protein